MLKRACGATRVTLDSLLVMIIRVLVLESIMQRISHFGPHFDPPGVREE